MLVALILAIGDLNGDSAPMWRWRTGMPAECRYWVCTARGVAGVLRVRCRTQCQFRQDRGCRRRRKPRPDRGELRLEHDIRAAERWRRRVGASTHFVTGLGPFAIAVGDVSGDGKPDVVVANLNANTVSVLRGNGTGGFGTREDFPTGTGPASVAVGDLSGDGKPDIAVENSSANTVSVLLGDGAGGFGAKTDLASGAVPFSVVIGDVSGDGKLDLAAANWSSSTVSVMPGDGFGGFGAKTDIGTGPAPRSIAIGDLNSDGRLDLATANEHSNTVSALLGHGSRTFATVKPPSSL